MDINTLDGSGHIGNIYSVHADSTKPVANDIQFIWIKYT